MRLCSSFWTFFGLLAASTVFVSFSIRHLPNYRTVRLFNQIEHSMTCKYNETSLLQWRSEHHLCVWFTTFIDKAKRAAIQLNTINNWCKFRLERMQPILFAVNATKYDAVANGTGWIRYQVPAVNAYGTPFLNDMINVMTNSSGDTLNSLFYGFANGDILFDESLPATLRAIAASMHLLPSAPILITGRRTNFELGSTSNLIATHDFDNIKMMKKKGKLFRTDAEDYFFFTHDFPWPIIRRLVIGRPAYDNYLVAMARRANVTVIDTTKTLTALHQMAPKEGNEAGAKNPDGNYNKKVIGKFRFSEGTTSRAAYETLSYGGAVYVANRQTKQVLQ